MDDSVAEPHWHIAGESMRFARTKIGLADAATSRGFDTPTKLSIFRFIPDAGNEFICQYSAHWQGFKLCYLLSGFAKMYEPKA